MKLQNRFIGNLYVGFIDDEKSRIYLVIVITAKS